jgi:tetratricopeptide (TPR) repeat protein
MTPPSTDRPSPVKTSLPVAPPESESRISPLATGKQQRGPDNDAALAARRAVASRLRNDDWEGAVAAIEGCEVQGQADSVLLQMKAQALASLGRMELAQQACTASLELDPLNAHAYLIRALVLAELDQLQAAEEALRRALYLDRCFIEAHYELGMLKIRAGDVSSGIKCLENALRLAREAEPEHQFHNSGGMTYGRFVQVLQSEIAIYRSASGASVGKQAARRN